MCIKLRKRLVEYIPHANKCQTFYYLPLATWCGFMLQVPYFTQFYNDSYKQIYYMHKLSAKQSTCNIVVFCKRFLQCFRNLI